MADHPNILSRTDSSEIRSDSNSTILASLPCDVYRLISDAKINRWYKVSYRDNVVSGLHLHKTGTCLNHIHWKYEEIEMEQFIIISTQSERYEPYYSNVGLDTISKIVDLIKSDIVDNVRYRDIRQLNELIELLYPKDTLNSKQKTKQYNQLRQQIEQDSRLTLKIRLQGSNLQGSYYLQIVIALNQPLTLSLVLKNESKGKDHTFGVLKLPIFLNPGIHEILTDQLEYLKEKAKEPRKPTKHFHDSYSDSSSGPDLSDSSSHSIDLHSLIIGGGPSHSNSDSDSDNDSIGDVHQTKLTQKFSKAKV